MGKTPADSGPDLASFLERTLAYYAPYSISDPSVSDIAAIKVSGHSGFSFTLKKGSSVEKGEAFLVGGKVYGVVAGGAAGSLNLATLTKFVGSFRFV